MALPRALTLILVIRIFGRMATALSYSRSVEQLSDGVLPSVQSVDRRVAAVHERSEVGHSDSEVGMKITPFLRACVAPPRVLPPRLALLAANHGRGPLSRTVVAEEPRA